MDRWLFFVSPSTTTGDFVDRVESSFVIRQDYTIKITTDQVAENYAYIYAKSMESIIPDEFERHTAVIESICNAVGETAYDEKRHSQKQRDIMLLTCEGDCSGHHESAWNAKESTSERPSFNSETEYIPSRFMYFKG